MKQLYDQVLVFARDHCDGDWCQVIIEDAFGARLQVELKEVRLGVKWG